VTVTDFLDRLRGRGATVKRERGGWAATCPNHPDKRPSLRIAEGGDGRVLLACRAGCRTPDVVMAAGLRLVDLFASAPVTPQRKRPRDPLAAARAEAVALGRRQAWARPGVVEMYEAADRLRHAARLRAGYTAVEPTDDDAAWTLLTEAAALTTTALNIFAEDAA
jgi:hypothetical protein